MVGQTESQTLIQAEWVVWSSIKQFYAKDTSPVLWQWLEKIGLVELNIGVIFQNCLGAMYFLSGQ